MISPLNISRDHEHPFEMKFASVTHLLLMNLFFSNHASYLLKSLAEFSSRIRVNQGGELLKTHLLV